MGGSPSRLQPPILSLAEHQVSETSTDAQTELNSDRWSRGATESGVELYDIRDEVCEAVGGFKHGTVRAAPHAG